MNRVKVFYCAGIMGLALFFVMLVVGGLGDVWAAMVVANPIQRPHDPVIVLGADLPAFDQAPINELRLYAYDGVDWQPIPMQIDERVMVSNTAVYTTFEDGLLDANDELVFMGHDADTMASIINWVNNAEARANPRYALAVTDPLQPDEVGYAYLYHAGTLAGSVTSYVAWSHSSQTLTGLSYTLSFDPNNFAGVADIRINGNSADILDRQKIRVNVDNPFPIPDVTLNEEDIVSFLSIPATVTLPIVGQVRAVGGGETNSFAFYGRRSDINVSVDLDSLPNPIPGSTITGLRTSFDLNDPSTTGMTPTVYYDSNTVNGVLVDGIPDTVPITPLVSWSEISGAAGGLVTLLDATVEMGTVSNYYLDDTTPPSGDTGDGVAFADSGAAIANPGGIITVAQAVYTVLPGLGSLGNTVKDWYDNPLQVAAAAQNYTLDHFLTVEKTVAASAAPGDLLTYTLTVEHLHVMSSTFNVVLTDTIPVGTSFVTATQPTSQNDNMVTWQRASLSSSETWQVQLVVQVPLTTTASIVENVAYGVRSDEVSAVLGEPVITDIVIKLGNADIFLPFIKR